MAKSSWRSDIARALGRSDVEENGVGRGNYSTNNGGNTYNNLGLTDRQTEIMNTYGTYNSVKETANALGISKQAVRNAIVSVAEKMGLDSSYSDDVYEEWRIADEYSSAADQTGDNYTDTAVEGGDHPWLYDSEGNYIG